MMSTSPPELLGVPVKRGPHRHCLDLSLSLLLLRLLSPLCIDGRSLWHWRWPEERPSLSSAAYPCVLCPSLSSAPAHLCPEATSPSWSSSEPRRKEAVSGKVGLNCPRIAESLFAGISLSSSTFSDVFVHHLWTRRPFQDWCCAEVGTSALLSTDIWRVAKFTLQALLIDFWELIKSQSMP